MAERESIGRTLLVAGGVALVCSLIVSSTVYWLRPIQLAYRSLDQNFAIIVAAGLAAPDATLPDSEVVERFLRLESRLIDLDSGTYAEQSSLTAQTYDFQAAADNPAQSREISKVEDIAGLGRRPDLMPVYILRTGETIDRVVLPIYGRGMWSTIYGYLCIEGDLLTVATVHFYEHGETPGIGDRIQDPAWIARWVGKRIYADDGTLTLRVGTGGVGSGAFAPVDAITGATVTVTAVDKFVRYWLGDAAYGPFLANLRNELN